MRELGQFLKQTRERLGMDLNEVEVKTKIRKRYLMALEDGEWRILPGEVYARGFVRSYAECLGLDGFELLQRYAPSSGLAHEENTVAPPVESDLHRNPVQQVEAQTQPPVTNDVSGVSRDPSLKPVNKAKFRPDRPIVPPKARRGVSFGFSGKGGQAVIVVAIFAALGASWWAVSRNNHPLQGHALKTTGATTNQTVAVANNTVANNSTTNTNNTVGNQVVTPPSTQVSAGPFQGNSQTYTVSTAGSMSIELTTTGLACWVSVKSDGVVVDGSDTIQPGTPKTWTGKQTVSIQLGHVEGVTLTVNGQPITLPQTNHPLYVVFQNTQSQG